MNHVALFTIYQNDSVFLKKWIEYHQQQFYPDDIYVLDHESTGDHRRVLGELELAYGFNVIPVTHEVSFDPAWLCVLATRFQGFLLTTYNKVVFLGTDEFLMVQDRERISLKKFIAEELAMPLGVVRAIGWEVVHDPQVSPALDVTKPWLAQRSSVYRSRRYSKPCVAMTNTRWQPGFHEATNAPAKLGAYDSGLRLVHLHRIDHAMCLARHRERAARRWLPAARENNSIYRHNLIEEPELLSRWLLCNADDQSQLASLMPIPAWMKGQL